MHVARCTLLAIESTVELYQLSLPGSSTLTQKCRKTQGHSPQAVPLAAPPFAVKVCRSRSTRSIERKSVNLPRLTGYAYAYDRASVKRFTCVLCTCHVCIVNKTTCSGSVIKLTDGVHAVRVVRSTQIFTCVGNSGG